MRNKKLAQIWYQNYRELVLKHCDYIFRQIDLQKMSYENNDDMLQKAFNMSAELRALRSQLNKIESALIELNTKPVVVTRRKVPDWLREEIMIEADYRCVVCSANSDLTIDHIVPVVAGGSNEKTNLRVLCRSCNSRKGTRF